MIIDRQLFNGQGKKIDAGFSDSDEIRLSFYFDDGDNWHIQLKRNTSKRELRDELLKLSNSIDEYAKL